MDGTLLEAREHFVRGMSRISQFWGFPKAMGAIFAVLYLSPDPLSLDQIVEQVNVSKGAVSVNVRNLERLSMVHPHVSIGERKDYYYAETDFWKIVRGVLKEREKKEFDQAIRSVAESLEMIEVINPDSPDAQMSRFYQQRLRSLHTFFNSLDNIVAMFLSLNELRLHALERFLGGKSAE